jgi:hypothetical protein
LGVIWHVPADDDPDIHNDTGGRPRPGSQEVFLRDRKSPNRSEPHFGATAVDRKEVPPMTRRIAHAAQIGAIVLALVLVPAALAAKGGASHGGGGGNHGGAGTTGSGSLSLAMVSDLNANGLPNWGDTVTFKVSTTATTEPNVSLTCSQNGVVVYGAVSGFYASYPWPWTQNMTLSSTSWTGGAASCVAKLYYISGTSTVNLGSMSFTAGA